MDNEEEILQKLGKDNIEILQKAIKEGKVDLERIREIAIKMGPSVNGTFKQSREERKTNVTVFNHMIDTWFNEVLCEEEINGYQQLIDILKKVAGPCKALAMKMTPVAQNTLAQEMTPVKSGLLSIGLPESHYEIPDLEDQSKTGSLPYPSSQSGLTCASHAIGKSILEILDSIGWDADQDAIIKALIDRVQPNEQAENPDKFDNSTIKVSITMKEDPGKTRDIVLEIRVQNRWGKVLGDHTFSTIPVAVDLYANKIRMVLRWNMWDSSRNNYVPHAIYAKNYDTTTKKYSCINSWGDNGARPQIHKSDVESIYYVSIKQVNL